MNTKELILDTVTDLVGEFMYYGRKEDEELSSQTFSTALDTGDVTIPQIVERFSYSMQAARTAERTAERAAERAAALYYLQNKSAGYVGNSPLFWHKSNSGYTQWLAYAKLFTEEEADKLIVSLSGSHVLIKHAADSLHSIMRLTVDVQDIVQ